jgi:hypothetical protein
MKNILLINDIAYADRFVNDELSRIDLYSGK